MRKYLAAFIIFVLCPVWSYAQVDEASSGKQTFSLSKKDNKPKENSSGRIQFNIKTVKVTGDSANRSFHKNESDNAGPEISISSPSVKRGFKIVKLNKKLMLIGQVDDESGILEVLVNGKEAEVSAEGQFWISVLLAYGDNTIEIAATDIHENTSIKSFVIERKAAETPVLRSNSSNQISWQFPLRNNESSTKEQVSLQACIQTSETIKEVNIFINDWKEKTITSRDLVASGDCNYLLSKEVKLHLDLNKVRIEVLTSKGTFDVVRDLYYKPNIGKYHALIIAVEDYTDPKIMDLDEPVADADKLYQSLNSKYNFDKENISYLKNPTKSEIFSALHKLRSTLTSNDNLLIFYAGHGYWDEEMNSGYWLPSDANQDNIVNWLSNSDLTNYINVIKTKHTLLVADACFSGGIFKTRSAFKNNAAINKLYDMPSRKAMTSGTLKEVPDKSIFMKYMLKRLEDNSEPYLTSEQLFSSMRLAVLNNSPNVPQYGTIQNVGDEGGDFIFILR